MAEARTRSTADAPPQSSLRCAPATGRVGHDASTRHEEEGDDVGDTVADRLLDRLRAWGLHRMSGFPGEGG